MQIEESHCTPSDGGRCGSTAGNKVCIFYEFISLHRALQVKIKPFPAVQTRPHRHIPTASSFSFHFFFHCVSSLANVSWDKIKQALYTHAHTHMHTYTQAPLFTTHAFSLTHVFGLTSTHLTRWRKSPVAHSSRLCFIFWALMPSSAVCSAVPGESRHSCCSDLITSGSNWWFCPHAPEPQAPHGRPRNSPSLMDPFNTSSTPA